ncbi:MAG TPA: GGDEF domain-containing phosphodiesterase [Steroidobacteraceae bacterium]|nr:GGDEF domain-containing phosphodiesterase [Steroidobacteraceae bacterium]
MPSDLLTHSLPDLIVVIRREGTVLEVCGGVSVPALQPAAGCVGQSCEQLWPAPVSGLMRQLARRAITLRSTTEASFQLADREYELRVSAQGPDRALCVFRATLANRREESAENTGLHAAPRLDRRGFMRRFRDSMSLAALREQTIAVAVIHIDGLTDIAQIIAPRISEQLMGAALQRLPPGGQALDGEPAWYLGQISDNLLAVVFETGAREFVERTLGELCRNLSQPIDSGDSQFHLKPFAGVAVLGQDASNPKVLLDHAQSAAMEARRRTAPEPCFFSDTMKLQSLARLDMARELGEAIANGNIRLRYRTRHDLATGALGALVGYLRWEHPFRGEIQPSEFLRVAETTGLATALSRRALQSLQQDAASLTAGAGGVRLSFGALHHHVMQHDFIADVVRLLDSGALPADRVELRVAEKTFVARHNTEFQHLQRMGVQLVIDEVGRGIGSLDALARAPIWGLQLDRAWVAALCDDPVARRVCHAGINLAHALGLRAIATGVDAEAQRATLLSLGCESGSGDLFSPPVLDIGAALRRCG